MLNDAVTIFFSYSHKDEALRDELAKHLASLKWSGYISTWHDRLILPGDEWDREVKDSLNVAQIILLLISSDFIASSYCYDIEIKRAMERHEAGEACVIPVILRQCMWSSAPFGKLQALPKNASPVTDSTTWPTSDDAFTNIAEGIKKAANDIRQKLRAAKQAKLERYETAYRQAIQQEYPLNETIQNKLNCLQVDLKLSEKDIASIVTRLSVQYGEAQLKLEKYRHELRLCLKEDGGKISPFSRTLLDGYRTTFKLTAEEATAVEQEELAPYQAKAKAVDQYTSVFADALNHENPLGEVMRSRMQRFQNILSLSDDEVQAIEKGVQQDAQTQQPKKVCIKDQQQKDENYGFIEFENVSTPKNEIKTSKLLQPDAKYKEISECDPAKILFLKNVRDPNGGWAYTIDRIQDIGGVVETRVFELFWLSTSRGAKSASKGDLMLLNQYAKITHVVEMLDDIVRENTMGYFRWVRVVWMSNKEDWSQLPHQKDLITFDPPTIGGGTTYSLANISKLQSTWKSLEAFQCHFFKMLTDVKSPLRNEVNETLNSEEFGANYYIKLRDLLAVNEWEAADKETTERMCEVMDRRQENCLYSDDIRIFPCQDLLNINSLWMKYSNEKFGFDAQKEIFFRLCEKHQSNIEEFPDLEVWNEFCMSVGWKVKETWLPLAKKESKRKIYPKGYWPLYRLFTKDETAHSMKLKNRYWSLLSRFSACYNSKIKLKD